MLVEGEYYEKHHIIPKCLNGTNDVDNIVILTAREHYIAHWLLVKIYSDVWKLYHAFYKMSNINTHQQRVVSSKQFARARKYLLLGMKMRREDPNYINPGKGENSRRAASARMNSANNPMTMDPGKNHTACPYTVVFNDNTQIHYRYGKLGYENLGIPRSTWILATRSGIGIPKYNIKQIIKHNIQGKQDDKT